MPAGTYVVMDGNGAPVGSEQFRCAPGPAGWRYFATRAMTAPSPVEEHVDISVDARWSPVRVRIESSSHDVILTARGDHLVGHRDGEPLEVWWDPAAHVEYPSPAFLAVSVNRLAGDADVNVVVLEPGTYLPRRERWRYELLGDETIQTPVGKFAARAWRAGQQNGRSRTIWVARDLVVKADGLFDLVNYEPLATGPVPIA